MKTVKIIFGVLAALFVLVHLLEIPSMMSRDYGDLVASAWAGKCVALIIGSLAAFGLFRSAFRKQDRKAKEAIS